DPAFWSYQLALGYLGEYPETTVVREWTLIGPPSREPVEAGQLVANATLAALQPGYYTLQLAVQRGDGVLLPPCERLIVYRGGP
ncbi:MAG: hypothetical protein JW910_18745, partial [Anaerolineae bacterium]|nr:hypothetical protein [Anaerolineae bacterium]